jgi:tRNA(Ile)-lysidine synthase
MPILEEFTRHLASLGLGPARAVVAVSGGTDSMALLDLLVRSSAAHGLDLVVAHVDHGIAPWSADVARVVAHSASLYGLPSETARLELGPRASETAARAARLASLEAIRLRQGADTLMLAHHADDQIETILMRLLRGSGPAGLAGIATRNGPTVHPLLPFRRQDLARYVLERRLEVWHDPANSDSRHLRSWIRNELIPVVQRRLPDAPAAILAVGDQARQQRVAWQQAVELLPGLEPSLEDGGISVAAPVLRGYDSALGAAVVAAVGRRVGCTIGPARAERVLAVVATGESGRSVPLGGVWRAELAFGRLRIVPAAAPAPADLLLGADGGKAVWGRWRFSVGSSQAPAEQARRSMTAWFPAGALMVRPPRRGERVAPLGGMGRRLLVRCFQDARIPRARRAGWPVIEAGGEAVWVPGVCRTEVQVPPVGSEALRVDVSYD